MTRFTRTLLIAGFALGTTLVSVANLQAGCGGGGGYRPHYPTYSRPSYHQPVYRPQPQPVYQPQQPSFQQQPGFSQSAPQPQQGFQQPAQQPQQGFQQPAQQQAPQSQAVAPTAPQSAPTTQSPAPADAQMTALQALAEMTGQTQPQAPATTAPAQPQTTGIAGNWTARLSNGAVVQLTLQADGRFNWSATNKDGKVSSFQGSYNQAGGSLTLTRTDSRKLEGTMTLNGNNGFNFKLAGANDNGLDFVRG